MDMFGFLAGASPWWWVALALALGVIEVLCFSFFLIWPGLAALAVGLVLWIFPELSGTAQLLGFAVLSAVFTLAGRWLVLNRPGATAAPELNNRAAQMIGRSAVIVDGFLEGGMGNVEIDGIRWRARMPQGSGQPAPGNVLNVAGAEGMVLILSPKG